MAFHYRKGQRDLQDRFDARKLADRIDERLVKSELGEGERAMIAGVDMFFMATSDGDGQPSCSYKGGDPGFVHVLDARTLAFPVWDGNGMFVSTGNLVENPRIGLLFVDFARAGRLRVEGRAELDEGELRQEWPEAQMAVRVAVERVYPNCNRYVHRYELIDRSRFVPREGCSTPEPGWKRSDWARDVVPKRK